MLITTYLLLLSLERKNGVSLKGEIFWEAFEKGILSNLLVLFENINKKFDGSTMVVQTQLDTPKQEITVGLDFQFDELESDLLLLKNIDLQQRLKGI